MLQFWLKPDRDEVESNKGLDSECNLKENQKDC